MVTCESCGLEIEGSIWVGVTHEAEGIHILEHKAGTYYQVAPYQLIRRQGKIVAFVSSSNQLLRFQKQAHP